MIGTLVSSTLTQKGPCGMTVNNDIDDDSATKHSDSHTLNYGGHIPVDMTSPALHLCAGP